jgi:phosphohistidine phosphatase SixA
MNKFALGFLFILASLAPAASGDLANLTTTLKQGGYVIVFRHVATDESQKDIYPFRFDDMKAQRQLSDKGREEARAIGASLKQLGIPLGGIYTSKLNRAIETGKLIAGKDVTPRDELTDSGAGSASKMANPEGDNEKVGRAIRQLVGSAPSTAVNSVLVTHKTNIADAFGMDFADVSDGEALIFKSGIATPVLVARVKANEWNGARN